MIDKKIIKPVLIALMIASLITSIHNPLMLCGLLISALLFFGLSILEERHFDTVVALQKKYESLMGEIISLRVSFESIEKNLITLQLKIKEVEKTKEILDKLEPEKMKQQIQTLIDSNNQLVLNMRNQSGGF